MFGEEELCGIKKLKLSNGTIKLPELTKAEYNERLYYFVLNNEVRLYSLEQVIIFTDTLLEYIRKNKSYKDFLRYKRTIFAKMMSDEKVKSSGRIKVPKAFADRLLDDKSIIFVGYNNHAKLFTSFDEYEKYKIEKKYN